MTLLLRHVSVGPGPLALFSSLIYGATTMMQHSAETSDAIGIVVTSTVSDVNTEARKQKVSHIFSGSVIHLIFFKWKLIRIFSNVTDISNSKETQHHVLLHLPWASVHWLVQCRLECYWNTTGWPSVHWDTTGRPSEYLQGTLERHLKSWNCPHWNVTGETLAILFSAYTGTPLEGL